MSRIMIPITCNSVEQVCHIRQNVFLPEVKTNIKSDWKEFYEEPFRELRKEFYKEFCNLYGQSIDLANNNNNRNCNAIDGSENDLFVQNEKEEEINENEREIVNVDGDSAEELDKSENDEL
ncbi:hypothetical protein C1645_819952 [Glomus cerebriforme]|uniref:Uncharacterized protein n=1 Tax=Glomus cerebriforme TaxID=658196 RepID=A0A397T400_9GLOM|nr:hypothetical protein C1645_819952 [Glomus cerebriforme]